jgi:hypothetical protein
MTTSFEVRSSLAVSSRNDVYRLLNTRAIWYCMRGFTEKGSGFAYAPTSAVLGPPSLEKMALQQLQREFVELFELGSQPLSVMPQGEDHLTLVRDLFAKRPGADVLFFEGFSFDSEREGVREQECIGDAIARSGKHVVLPSGQAADQWHDKRRFREEVMTIHGPEAVPYGESFDAPSMLDLARFVWRAFASGVDRIVFKASGYAGKGNLIVDRRKSTLESIMRRLSGIRRFRRRQRGSGSDWVSAEHWKPWVLSGISSFFVLGERDPPVHMATVQQILGERRGTYLGSRSFIDLSERDQNAVADLARPVIRLMQSEGLRGFAGMDWIISKPDGSRQEILLPDSGLAFRFVEATARIGAHNRELRTVSLLADREGRATDDLVHLCVRNHPIAGAGDRPGAVAAFRRALEGIAEPLDARSLQPHRAYFLLVCNHLGHTKANDAVMFVGLGGEQTEARIRQAHRLLLRRGVLRT